jgi:EAL domain-containing protein (putative c-di-GMP-specific phosphodiesterase class I)
LREAEIAMYRAKRAGPDRIEIFNVAMRTEKDGRLALESDLRRAIERKQLRLVYQPIFYLPTEQLAGFEALLRWEHPSLGTLNPTDFVPAAEESDLIVKLGSYVLARAVREAARWHKELPRPEAPLFVGVNVSSRQLFRPELTKEVRHILGRAVIPKGSLRLEITESLVMENPEKATAVLRQLADAGAGLALDDFGTGYSSLSYLNQFTFDTIKIDRSFLHAGGENGAGSVILRSVVALAHELGKKVVIEGVETEDDVGLLRSIGCEYGQGFYYGEPMSEREVLQLLKVARRAERRMSRKSSAFRRRPRTEEAPAAAPIQASVPAAAPVSVPTTTPPRSTPIPNGTAPHPVSPSKVRAPVTADPTTAPPPEVARPSAGPPPLPVTHPLDTTQDDGVLHGTLPPTPLQPAAPPTPERAAADPLPAAASSPVRTPRRIKTGPPPLPPTSGPPAQAQSSPPPAGRPTPRPPPLPAAPGEPPQQRTSALPPAIAESLARLAHAPDGDGSDRQ